MKTRIGVLNWNVIAELSDGQNVVVQLPIELEQKVGDFVSQFEQEINDKVEQELGE